MPTLIPDKVLNAEVTYGCWKGWHDKCIRHDCGCDCHVNQQLPIEGLPALLLERAADAAEHHNVIPIRKPALMRRR